MIMTKVPEFPRPHDADTLNFAMGVESAIVNRATIIPIIHYDEGLGVINSYKSHPQNTNFLEIKSSSCYPTSRVNNIYAELKCSLSKEALQTDKIHSVNFATMKIFTSFNEGGQAEDEISTQDLNEILELQVETTDRQTYPLYNGVKLKTYKSNAGLDMPATQLGLTTDLEIEGVVFVEDDWYDCLQYYTNGKKMRTMTSGLKWHTLSQQHPTKSVYFNQDSSTKYMNPYAFLGVLVYVPPIGFPNQFGKAGDTTDVNHVEFGFKYRYNEFNHEFNHALQ